MERKPLKRVPIKRKVSGIASGIKRATKRRETPVKRIKKKPWKFVKTHLAECDSAFSKEIIARDTYCLFPGCDKTDDLTNSHYIGRANWNTRFDPDNCITLCTTHHFWDKTVGWEYQKQRIGVKGCDWNGRYTVFMMNFLGETRWNALMERANGNKTRKESLLEAQKKYNLRQPEA